MHLRDKFTGTWKLKEWVYRRKGREDSHPYGVDASGMLMYNRHGSMSAILMRADRSEESDSGYVSYYGTYKVDQQSVTHHVELSLRPQWLGKSLVRSYEFKEQDQILILSTRAVTNAKGELSENILTWIRNDQQVNS